MPEADADAQVVLHALAEDHPVGLIDLEGQRVRGQRDPERDAAPHGREERLAHPGLPRAAVGRRCRAPCP